MAQDPKIGREILPIPDQPYRGPVPFDARGASAPPQPMLHAPKGAPNVVIVLVDDMGFGVPSGFGGCMNMPTTDRLAKGGLCYNQFHTTAGAGGAAFCFLPAIPRCGCRTPRGFSRGAITKKHANPQFSERMFHPGTTP